MILEVAKLKEALRTKKRKEAKTGGLVVVLADDLRF
jgi:hypothetical protein